MITSSQIKAARAMTGLTVRALAEHSEIAFSTLVRLESAGNEITSGQVETLKRLMAAFDTLNIEFNGTPESGAGVRWKS